jgi:hypothetical protein
MSNYVYVSQKNKAPKIVDNANAIDVVIKDSEDDFKKLCRRLRLKPQIFRNGLVKTQYVEFEITKGLLINVMFDQSARKT